MTRVQETYVLSKIQQLVDLNNDVTNFNLTFNATTKDGTPFDVVVVDQTILDSGEPLEFRQATNGTISGNIVSDKNVYQNYFLALKSDKECECDVTVTLQEIPPQTGNVSVSEKSVLPGFGEKMGFNWKTAAVIGVCLILGGIVLYVYMKPKKGGDVPESKFSSPPKISSPDKVSSTGQSSSGYGKSVNNINKGLLDRLNALNIA